MLILWLNQVFPANKERDRERERVRVLCHCVRVILCASNCVCLGARGPSNPIHWRIHKIYVNFHQNIKDKDCGALSTNRGYCNAMWQCLGEPRSHSHTHFQYCIFSKREKKKKKKKKHWPLKLKGIIEN